MSAPHTVVFDLGKVLLDFDYLITARLLAPKCQFNPEQLCQIIGASPLLARYEVNAISTGEFFLALKTMAGFSGDFYEFSRSFADIFTPIDPMIQLHRNLRQRGLPTFIFSNTNQLAVQHIRQSFPFFHDFDGYILSCEHGAMKPDPKLYAVVEQCTKQRGPELLYIDDRPENIEAGAARGWQTILHQSPRQTIAAVEALGLIHPKQILTRNIRVP